MCLMGFPERQLVGTALDRCPARRLSLWSELSAVQCPLRKWSNQGPEKRGKKAPGRPRSPGS